MKEQNWIDVGYKKYSCKHWKEHADYLLQKCVRDREGNKTYFINVYAYDWSKPEWVACGIVDRGVTFSYEVGLFTQEEKEFRVSGEVSNIEELEKWIEHLYSTLNCIPSLPMSYLKRK